MLEMPKFMTSEYAYSDEDGWHLRDDAPEELKDELAEWRREMAEAEAQGICV